MTEEESAKVARVMTEEQLQRAVADYLDICEAQGKLKWHAVPNGGHMSIWMGRRRKRLGAKAGAPDLVIYWPGGDTLQVELKTAKGRLSKSQQEWQEHCRRLGLKYIVCRSVDELISIASEATKVNPNQGIDALQLSKRPATMLKRYGVLRVEQLLRLTQGDILRIKNLGRKSLNEIRDRLSQNDLKLKDDWCW